MCVGFFLIIIMTVTCYKVYTPRHVKTCLPGFTNNKGRDLPIHPPSLINTLFESIISRLATSEISIFLLVSVAEQAGLNPTLLETPKTDFLSLKPILL